MWVCVTVWFFSSNVTGVSLLGTAHSRKFGPRLKKNIFISVSGIYFVNELKHENSPPQAEFFLGSEIPTYIFVKEI